MDGHQVVWDALSDGLQFDDSETTFSASKFELDTEGNQINWVDIDIDGLDGNPAVE